MKIKCSEFAAMPVLLFLLSGCQPPAPESIAAVPNQTAKAVNSWGDSSYKEATKELEKNRKTIEVIVQKRAPLKADKARITARLQAQSKVKKMTLQYITGKEMQSSKYPGLGSIIEFMGHKPAALAGILSSIENFSIHGKTFRAGTAHLFDKKEKLIKVFVWVLEGMPTLGEVKTAVRKEVLIGSDKLKVEAWLKSKNFKGTYISSKDSDLSRESDVLYSKCRPADLSGILRERIWAVGFTIPVRWDIQMIFFFGKDDKLKGYSVRQIGDGP